MICHQISFFSYSIYEFPKSSSNIQSTTTQMRSLNGFSLLPSTSTAFRCCIVVTFQLRNQFSYSVSLFLFACNSHHFASFHCEFSSGKQSEKSKWMHQKSTNRKLSVCRQRCLAHTHTPHSHPHTHSHTHTQLGSYQSCMK